MNLIVFDEGHWGKGGIYNEEIFALAEKYQIPILALSGTPKFRKNWKTIYSISFQELVEKKFLAKPIFESVSTGIIVDASQANARKCVDKIHAQAEEYLASSKKRNQTIVDYYDFNIHGKTIVFAVRPNV